MDTVERRQKLVALGVDLDAVDQVQYSAGRGVARFCRDHRRSSLRPMGRCSLTCRDSVSFFPG
ncbi:hypothetical protein ACVH9Z_22685 [Rhodococcus opacus]|uniref:hypothetical protein n=1 Tax=Rhodococcus opacus TaxID=37919 RepID=UPI001FEF93A5|nr:hypothetical protein [Rhodococcus opacus]